MKRWAALGTTVVLAGCAVNVPPSPTADELALPADYSQELPTVPGADGPWWLTLDPALDPLVAEALEHNYQIEAAIARMDAALAQAAISGADLEPQLAGTIDLRRQKQIFNGLPLPGGDTLSSTSNAFGVGLNLSWEIDVWGRIRAQVAAAEADVEASVADLDGAKLSLAGQTSKAWFTLGEIQQQLELAERTVTTRRDTVRRIQRRYEIGQASSTDLRLARANVGRAESLLATRQRQLDLATRQLEILLGRYPGADLVAANDLTTLPPPVPVGVPADLITRRPDLAAAERRLAASGARVAAARAALMPRISLSGGVGTNTQEIDRILSPNQLVWNLAGNLLQPIFQGGRLRAGIELSEARQREILAGYQQQILVALLEVEASLAAERLLETEEATLRTVSAESAAAWKTAERRYFAGIGDYLSVLESQRQSLEADGRLLEIRRLRLTNRVDLHLALGGDLPEEASASETSEAVETSDAS